MLALAIEWLTDYGSSQMNAVSCDEASSLPLKKAVKLHRVSLHDIAPGFTLLLPHLCNARQQDTWQDWITSYRHYQATVVIERETRNKSSKSSRTERQQDGQRAPNVEPSSV